jgi:hypothetical protein
MERRDEEPRETAERRSRGTALRLAGAGLASVLALGVPMDGSGRVSAGGDEAFAPNRLPGFTVLPAGWPDPSPELKDVRESDIWSTVQAACAKYGISDEAVTMFLVLWEESRFAPRARSECGRYHGIGQFTHSTFRWSVERMRRLGLIWGEDEWSPLVPAQAIEVMAWMWSRGDHNHWGPYRRVVGRLAASEVAERPN